MNECHPYPQSIFAITHSYGIVTSACHCSLSQKLSYKINYILIILFSAQMEQYFSVILQPIYL
jgi:hypothetical protein